MPYYVFRVGALGIPELLGSAPGYRDAKKLLNELRGPDPGSGPLVRMVFGENEIEAAELLARPRESAPVEGDDD